MDEVEETCVLAERDLDRISSLPDTLLCQVLLNCRTKDVVRTSLLSSRWRNLWKHVPGLDLSVGDFPNDGELASFVDSFLDFIREACLEKFCLIYDNWFAPEPELDFITRWCNTIVHGKKLKHLEVLMLTMASRRNLEIPPTLYTCETLEVLKLSGGTLASPKFLSLPCLKVIELNMVKFTEDMTLETLISSCPVLESLYIGRDLRDGLQVLRVRSQTLLRFSHFADWVDDAVEDLVVAIDVPKLQCLRLDDYQVSSFIIVNHMGSLAQVVGISTVKVMSIGLHTLEVLLNYSRCESLPLFRNLLCLEVTICIWETLPIILQSCPNLKSLVVDSVGHIYQMESNIEYRPQCLLSSLEHISLKWPLEGEAIEMKLVRYLLENSKTLKTLTLSLDDSKIQDTSVIIEELLTISSLSTSC
ncbi:unnamed protein product [Cochlearia groenlandica]